MAKLGTRKRPAVVRAGAPERAQDILALCNERGWHAIIGAEPDEPEDISDVEELLRSREPVSKPRLPPRISGNDYCPCRSGKKFKNCCGSASATPSRNS